MAEGQEPMYREVDMNLRARHGAVINAQLKAQRDIDSLTYYDPGDPLEVLPLRLEIATLGAERKEIEQKMGINDQYFEDLPPEVIEAIAAYEQAELSCYPRLIELYSQRKVAQSADMLNLDKQIYSTWLELLHARERLYMSEEWMFEVQLKLLRKEINSYESKLAELL